jgi:hypothetical protein
MDTNLWWFTERQANDHKRYRLCDRKKPIINNDLSTATIYFIDRDIHTGWGRDKPYQLYGSGLHPSGCAQLLGYFHTLQEAKKEAERIYIS